VDERAGGSRGATTGDEQHALRLGRDIAERFLDLAVAVAGLIAKLPKDTGGRHVASQLFRSATSSGANYEEARGAESREDFVHKIGVAAKEVREAAFWLRLIQRSGWIAADLADTLDKTQKLAAILGASVRTARGGRSSSSP